MKKIIEILAALMMCLTLNSCVVTAQADDMYDDVDISLIVTYGTPFYDTDGLLLYYIYRDMFYYPYYYHNRYYLHRYSRPLPPLVYKERYKPIQRNAFNSHKPNFRHDNHRPNINHHRPNIDIPSQKANIDRQIQRPNINIPTQRSNDNSNARSNVTQPKVTPNINNRNGNRTTITTSRPNMRGNRAITQPRSSTGATTKGGHFGGRR